MPAAPSSFHSWKFEIVGPLALLSLLARRGFLCVLGAVDAQVFWELLAQLLEEPRYRPPNQPFNSVNLPGFFGEIYHALDRLPIGESIDLADVAALRRHYLQAEPISLQRMAVPVIFGMSASAEAPPSRVFPRAAPLGSSRP